MGLRKLYLGYLQLKRALQILIIIAKHALKRWYNGTKLRRWLTRKSKRGLRVNYTTPERLRMIIEELGPTFIKFGQILADRPDFVTERFRNELKKLQSKAEPFDNYTARNIIEDELGSRIEDVFEWFDNECLASASIGQVYKARLKSGESVIVKIQRPNIKSTIKLDLYLMRFLAKKGIKNFPELATINILGLIEEFGSSIMKELNYYNEASNILRFNEMFKDDPRLYVPKVILEYSTSQLLVMEYIEGVTPDNVAKLKSHGLDPAVIAENGADIILKMVLQYGFFHADPHPGNIFILPGNIISFVDYGMVGVLKPNHLSFLASFAMGFYKNNPKTITKSLVTLCEIKFFDDFAELEFEIDQLLKNNAYKSFSQMDFSGIMQDCINLMVKYELAIPSNIFLLVKAIATIQKFATNLNPKMNLTSVIMPYARNLMINRFNPRRIVSDIYDSITDYVTLVKEMPRHINEILYKIKQGTINIEIGLQESEPIISSIKNFGSRIALVILIIGMLGVSTALLIWSPDKQFAKIMFIITLLFSSWVTLKLFFSKKK